MSSALLLGGGAPTLTLQSGALAALDEKGVEFTAVSTAGAGMVIGLLYAAPKGMTRQEALKNTVNMGVADEIYNAFPVNYKVFFKPGDMASLYRNFLAMLPQMPVAKTQADRLFGDWMGLVCATLSPSSLSPDSLGLCAPAPWIDHVVDFEKLQDYKGEFYINAYNVSDHRMEIFSKDEITPDHFRAALAFPFIYPPYRLNGKYYIEGSAMDTLCFKGLRYYREKQAQEASGPAGGGSGPGLAPLKNLIVFDVLSSDRIIRTPRTLYEAWIQSIMIPLVEIAKDDIALFDLKHRKSWGVELLRIQFDIPEDHWPYALDWSYSNLKTLYDVGYDAGLKFYEEHKEALQPRAARRRATG
ncbi:MAG: patatin-like phospholipase family protein [Geminicoccaceae bacterium]